MLIFFTKQYNLTNQENLQISDVIKSSLNIICWTESRMLL